MASEHDNLIIEYNKYKEELAEHEKKLFAYNSKIEDYGKQISDSISELQRLGVEIPVLTSLVDSDGNIDLANKDIVKQLIDAVYALYQQNINNGMAELNSRKPLEVDSNNEITIM